MKGGLNDIVGAGQVDRPTRVRQAECLFWTQRPFIPLVVKLDITASALVTEPLANVTLIGTGALRKSQGCNWALGKLFVQAEAISNQHQCGAHGSAEITDRLAEKLIEFRFVDGHVSLLHRISN